MAACGGEYCWGQKKKKNLIQKSKKERAKERGAQGSFESPNSEEFQECFMMPKAVGVLRNDIRKLQMSFMDNL